MAGWKELTDKVPSLIISQTTNFTKEFSKLKSALFGLHSCIVCNVATVF